MSKIHKFKDGENRLRDFEDTWMEHFKKKGYVKVIAFKSHDDPSFKFYPFLELKTVWYNTDGADVIFELKDGTWADKIPIERLIGIIKRE